MSILNAGPLIHSLVFSCKIPGGQKGTARGFSSSLFRFPS
jgi:hypothetical protein